MACKKNPLWQDKHIQDFSKFIYSYLERLVCNDYEQTWLFSNQLFFGDFNQIFDALTNGDYRSASNAEFLFANINKVIAILDERIGKIVGFSESEIHFLNGETRIGTSILFFLNEDYGLVCTNNK